MRGPLLTHPTKVYQAAAKSDPVYTKAGNEDREMNQTWSPPSISSQIASGWGNREMTTHSVRRAVKELNTRCYETQRKGPGQSLRLAPE